MKRANAPVLALTFGMMLAAACGRDSNRSKDDAPQPAAAVPPAAMNNQAPGLNVIENQRGRVGERIEFKLNAHDPDGDQLFYSCVNAENPCPIGLSVDATGLVSWQPGYGQSGAFRVKFAVTDGTSWTLQSAYITIDPSTVPWPDATADGVRRVVAIAEREFQEPLLLPMPSPGEWTCGDAVQPCPRGLKLDRQSRIVWTPTADQVGLHTVRFHIQIDGRRYDRAYEFNVLERVAHSHARVVLGKSKTVTVEEGQTAIFQVYCADADTGEPLRIQKADSSATGLTLTPKDNGETEVSLKIDFTSAGNRSEVARIRCKIPGTEDWWGNWAEVAMTAQVVNKNLAPQVTLSGPQQVRQKQKLRFTVQSKDPDGSLWSQMRHTCLYRNITSPDSPFRPCSGPGWSWASGSDYEWTPGFDDLGKYEIKVEVTDDNGDVGYASHFVDVKEWKFTAPQFKSSFESTDLKEGDRLRQNVQVNNPDNIAFTLRCQMSVNRVDWQSPCDSVMAVTSSSLTSLTLSLQVGHDFVPTAEDSRALWLKYELVHENGSVLHSLVQDLRIKGVRVEPRLPYSWELDSRVFRKNQEATIKLALESFDPDTSVIYSYECSLTDSRWNEQKLKVNVLSDSRSFEVSFTPTITGRYYLECRVLDTSACESFDVSCDMEDETTFGFNVVE